MTTEAFFFLASIIVGVVGWLLQRSIAGTDKDVNDLALWKDKHETDSFKWREEFMKKLAEVESLTKVSRSQYDEIIRRLDRIDEKVDRIETRDEN